MVDVFISYKREERARCERIHEKLKALDLDVWFDARLTAGKSFDREIEAAVKASRAVVVLWSPASVESAWVREEASVGKARDVLAAIRIAACDLPFGFGSTHVEAIHEPDFADDHPGWLKILDRIGQLTQRPELADYSRAIGEASARLIRFAERNPASPLAERARSFALSFAAMGSEATAPLVTRLAPPPASSGPQAAWADIEASLDPLDYADFLEVYPQSERAFDARRHRRGLEAWASLDQTDPVEVTAFLRSGSFPALQTRVQSAADALAAAAGRSLQLNFPATTRADDARVAAVARRGSLARSFWIDLPGLASWPRQMMVALPPGRILMGSPQSEERWEGYDCEEEPLHEVRIDHVFALGRGPVTVDAFAAFMAETGHDTGDSALVMSGDRWENTPRKGRGWRDPGFPQAGDHPVTCVDWSDAHAFIAWLNHRLDLTGQADAYRLPSEAEWEYACRAGTQTPFSFGAAINTDQANVLGMVGYGGEEPSMLYRRATTPIDRFPANAFGLHDMHGNTWDWCEDAWNKTYGEAPSDGSAWLTGEASMRLLRGGCWAGPPHRCRSAQRHKAQPIRISVIGFRLARTLLPPAA